MAYALSRSPQVTALFVAPGNPGTLQCATNVPIGVDQIDDLVAFANDNAIDLTVVGPEQPLAMGIVDVFLTNNRAIVGPTQVAAKLESSKVWAKSIYKAYGIPTASYRTFTVLSEALAYVRERASYPIVIKADGLAAGKGVTVALTDQMAEAALTDCLHHHRFGESGHEVVIEDYLVGEEASLFAFTDGHTVLPMVSAQDHKAIFDGDKGPNTGGMGAYSPAPVVTPCVQQAVMDRILVPLVEGLRRDGIVYKGILYAGLMIDADDNPHVIEFNVRFGDPEAQVVLPRLNTDLVSIFQAIVTESLHQITLEWSPGYTAGVVMSSKGYPGAYSTGHRITGLDDASGDDSYVIHSGTSLTDSGEYETNGGRVLTVCGEGTTLSSAIQAAYKRCERIHFEGAYYRTDIGQKGRMRQKK